MWVLWTLEIDPRSQQPSTSASSLEAQGPRTWPPGRGNTEPRGPRSLALWGRHPRGAPEAGDYGRASFKVIYVGVYSGSCYGGCLELWFIGRTFWNCFEGSEGFMVFFEEFSTHSPGQALYGAAIRAIASCPAWHVCAMAMSAAANQMSIVWRSSLDFRFRRYMECKASNGLLHNLCGHADEGVLTFQCMWCYVAVPSPLLLGCTSEARGPQK